MSHHLDTLTAQEDPRIDPLRLYLFRYLFRGRPGTIVLAMTVNPDAAVSAPDTSCRPRSASKTASPGFRRITRFIGSDPVL